MMKQSNENSNKSDKSQSRNKVRKEKESNIANSKLPTLKMNEADQNEEMPSPFKTSTFVVSSECSPAIAFSDPEKRTLFNCLATLNSMAPKSQIKEVNSTSDGQVKSALMPTMDSTVHLNVYSLNALNSLHLTGIGVYHTGVEVYGVEWAYGGYPYPVSSIFRMKKPRDLASLSDINERFRFIESIDMGHTRYTYNEVKLILMNMGKKEWIGTNYHLLYRNCNHFSNELCKLLCNTSIPSWINRLASAFSKFPFLIRLIPDEYFTPVALQDKLQTEQALKYELAKSVFNQETVKIFSSNNNKKSKSKKLDEKVCKLRHSPSKSLVKSNSSSSRSSKSCRTSPVEDPILRAKCDHEVSKSDYFLECDAQEQQEQRKFLQSSNTGNVKISLLEKSQKEKFNTDETIQMAEQNKKKGEKEEEEEKENEQYMNIKNKEKTLKETLILCNANNVKHNEQTSNTEAITISQEIMLNKDKPCNLALEKEKLSEEIDQVNKVADEDDDDINKRSSNKNGKDLIA